MSSRLKCAPRLENALDVSFCNVERIRNIYRLYSRQIARAMQLFTKARLYEQYTGVRIPHLESIPTNLSHELQSYFRDRYWEARQRKDLADEDTRKHGEHLAVSTKTAPFSPGAHRHARPIQPALVAHRLSGEHSAKHSSRELDNHMQQQQYRPMQQQSTSITAGPHQGCRPDLLCSIPEGVVALFHGPAAGRP